MPLSPKRAASAAYSMVMFAVVSVLAGLLIAGLIVPFAGIAGVGARATASGLENLPADLATPPQAERTKVLLADGSLLANFYDENRVNVTLKNIAPAMRKAQVAIEDHRFYEHGALDLKGTFRALASNQAGGATQGGSSITQQYVKMIQVEKAYAKGDKEGVQKAKETTYARKVQELRYAIALEKRLTKDQILEGYLNIAYYGDGAYGVEAAAHHYFDTTAKKLTLPQAAMLAGLVQNPNNVNPVANKKAAIQRRNVVLTQMVKWQMISQSQATKAQKAKFDSKKVTSIPNGCIDTRYPFLCDYVKRSLLESPALGKTKEQREQLLTRGGLTIDTEIDPKTQNAAQKAIKSRVSPKDPVISVMTMIEPGTGLILAMAQSRPKMGTKKGQTYHNYAVTQDMGGVEGYQAGSTFKTFTAAAALDEGIPLSKRYNARSPMNFGGQTFESCDGKFVQGNYTVKNSTGHNGIMNMYEGAKWSVNTYFVQLEQQAGICKATQMAEKAGVKLSLGGSIPDQYSHFPSFTLGAVEVTPLSMANAYATFAARGMHCNPVIVKKITTREGKEIKMPGADCKQVIPTKVADGVNRLLKGVMQGTGRPAYIDGYPDQAGKTGTIDDSEAVWFTGYTPNVAGAAMIAIDKTKKPFKKTKNQDRRSNGLRGYTLPKSGTYLEGSGGGDVGRWIYKPAMEKVLDGRPKTKFKSPPEAILEGKKVDVPNVSGLSWQEAQQQLEDAGFTVQKSYHYNSAPQGTYLGVSTYGRAPEKSTIYLIFSAGEDPAVVAQRQRDEQNRRAAAQQAQQQRDQQQAQQKRDQQQAQQQQKKDQQQAQKKQAQKKKAQKKKDQAKKKPAQKKKDQPKKKKDQPKKKKGKGKP